jgi:hypothetical protein
MCMRPIVYSEYEVSCCDSSDDSYLWAVPEKFRTEVLCTAAVLKCLGSNTLAAVPVALRTVDMCRIAVANIASALEFVPEALRTAELCKIAVAKDGWALVYVPVALRTVALCSKALAVCLEQDEDQEFVKEQIPVAIRLAVECKSALLP